MSMQSMVVLWLTLSTLLLSAAGQGCPSSICNSFFANTLGGPVDCCNHKFESSLRCEWGGTPVSFRLARTCTANGKQYRVLVPGNSQGQGGNDQCRCSNPAVSTPPPGITPTVKMTVELKARSGQDIKGSDLGCEGQSVCKICSGLQTMQAACAVLQRCVAFTFEVATGCGYLKTAAEPTSARSGWVVYSRL